MPSVAIVGSDPSRVPAVAAGGTDAIRSRDQYPGFATAANGRRAIGPDWCQPVIRIPDAVAAREPGCGQWSWPPPGLLCVRVARGRRIQWVAVVTVFPSGTRSDGPTVRLRTQALQVLRPMLALVDMRGNLFAVAVLLCIGVVLLRWLRSPSASRQSRRWIPVVAFLAGPLSAFGWYLSDVFFISPEDYISPADYVEALLPILTIGASGGVIGAAVFWIAERLPIHRAR